MSGFKANALPLLIGSLPMKDHKKAAELILEYTPEIPLWPQLPLYREEGMMAQFLPGMPGFTESPQGKLFIDTAKDDFDEEYLKFYEDYLAVTESGADLAGSRFTLTHKAGRGFYEFLRQIDALSQIKQFIALKGQVSGPVTFATGVCDENGRAIFYNDQMKDAVIKHLAMNGKWQAEQFALRGYLPIIFFDEPGLAGFGSSAFITITKQDVKSALDEVIKPVHDEKGLAGVHVCANTEWDLLLDSKIDIISFDSYSFFDKFMLYPEKIKTYMKRGGILAWGIVPTSNKDDIERETEETLFEKLSGQIDSMTELGISREMVIEQSFVTPSCGTGSIDFKSAQRVLFLTSEVSKRIRSLKK